ncbi:MAG: YkgJ family cysteine cluster protein [Promethearchaeota archaeon]
MKCPFCNKEIKHLAIHIKQNHPKKFKFLEKTKPDLYIRLQKELKILEMKKNRDPNLLTLKLSEKTHFFEYKCIRCGICCHIWEIEIQPEDIQKWTIENREELLYYIQIYPQSISVMNLGLIQRLAGKEKEDFNLGGITFIRKLTEREKLDKQVLIQKIVSHLNLESNEDLNHKLDLILNLQDKIIGYYLIGDVSELDESIIKKISELKDFILKNHEYLGEPKVDRWGNPLEDSTLNYLKQQLPQYFDEKFGILKGKIPHWLLGINYGPRAILSPKSFEVITEGWKKGLSYYLIYELQGGCGFLKNNLCSIHEYKPLACKLFPYNRRKLDLEADKLFLETCKGLKKIL